jgi:glycosyltransferase involved in cell wall biosynthesis
LREFVQSDLLLFPSLSEGSALVLAEAAASGLPAIATRESGPPESAFLIEKRNPAAIRDSISRILHEPTILTNASKECILESRRRTPETFMGEIAALARYPPEGLSNRPDL